MTDFYETLAARIEERFGEHAQRIASRCGELTYQVDKDQLIEVATVLRDEPAFRFEQLMDVCGVDYLSYGQDEWTTESATESGFSRGVDRNPVILDEADSFDSGRFAVVYHLLSLHHNARLRLRVYTGIDNPPIVRSLVDVWSSANWFER
ncbi:MAG TPA: NADH-quinone oxidoreductase subunit C, partial [Woeseiaceae bacterium]